MLRVWMQESIPPAPWMDEVPGALGRRGRRGRRRASSPGACGSTPTACCAHGVTRRDPMPRRPPRTARTAAASASAARSSAAPTPAPGAPRASRATSPPTSARRRASRSASPRRRWQSPWRSSATRGSRSASRSDRPLALVAARLDDVAPGGVSTLVTTQVFNLTHLASHESAGAARARPGVRGDDRAGRDRPVLPGRPPPAPRPLADLLAVGVAFARARHAHGGRR